MPFKTSLTRFLIERLPKNIIILFASTRHLGCRLPVYKTIFQLNLEIKPVTQAHSSRKNWFHQNGYIIFPLLAFAIPLIVRAIPEVLMGQYLVGFDTIGYYVPNTLTWLGNGVSFWGLISSAPLMYILLMGITSTGVPILFTLKITGTLLVGLLGFTTYLYANKGLSLPSKKSLTVAILSTLYFISLRISWDMFRSELAFIFLFIALTILQRNGKSVRNGLLLSLTMALVVFSHQLVAIIMFAIIIASIASFTLKKKKAELRRIIVFSIPAALLLLLVFYLNYFGFSSPVMGYSGNIAGGFETLATASHTQLVIDTLGFLAFCYLPLVPFLIFAIKKVKSNLHFNAWILWAFIPILLLLINPSTLFLGGVLPFRWILLLTYPLSFYAVEGLFAIKRSWYKLVYKIAVCALIAVLSVSFIVLPNSGAISYFGGYPTYVPKSMLQNTMQLSDCQDTANAILWTKNNMPSNGHLLVHEAFYGWAELKLDNNRIIYYGFGNPEDAARQSQENNSSNPLYLIWWVNGTGWYGQPTVPASFKELYHSGNIAIYQYSGY